VVVRFLSHVGVEETDETDTSVTVRDAIPEYVSSEFVEDADEACFDGED